MNNDHMVINYIRVSTMQQNVEMQRASARQYIEKYKNEQILEICDHGVSAIKTPMKKRTGLCQLLDLIRTGKVKIVIVYERDRLARNLYEYLRIVKEFYKYKVEVVFSATNARPFDKNIVIESIAAMFSQMEGTLIKTRRSDAMKQFPVALYGYKKEKDIEGKVRYIHDRPKSEFISNMFSDFCMCKEAGSFLQSLKQYKKNLNQPSPDKVLRMLMNPFYAGLVVTNSGFQLLPHVDPIIDQDLFESVQTIINAYKQQLPTKQFERKDYYGIQPHCGICNSSMQLIQTANKQIWACKSHKRNYISLYEFDQIIRSTIFQSIQQISITKLKGECLSYLRENRRRVINEIGKFKKMEEQICQNILHKQSTSEEFKQVQSLFEKLAYLLDQKKQLSERLNIFERAEASIDHLADTIISKINESIDGDTMQNLSNQFIYRIEIFPEYLSVSLYFNEFMKKDDGDEAV